MIGTSTIKFTLLVNMWCLCTIYMIMWFLNQLTYFLFGVSAKHFSDEVSTTVSQNPTTGSDTLISVCVCVCRVQQCGIIHVYMYMCLLWVAYESCKEKCFEYLTTKEGVGGGGGGGLHGNQDNKCLFCILQPQHCLQKHPIQPPPPPPPPS